MKFVSLSGHPNKPCGILKFKETMIMLDAALDPSSLFSFLPLPLVQSNLHFSSLSNWAPKEAPDLESELKECAGRVFVDSSPEFCCPELTRVNLKHVDVILISNYQCMLALPYITEGTDFEGVVYATEPTLLIGRQFMEEMVTYIERSPKVKQAFRWKEESSEVHKQIPFPTGLEPIKPHNWRQMYSMKELNSSLSKVKLVGFNEKTDIFGSLQVTALSSGYSIGSCNWIINTHYEKVVYLSSASTLTTHPQPMEIGPLKNPDLLILTNLSQTPTSNPDGNLGELCMNVALTLKNGGNVLIPCYSSGVIYDLFECLVSHLEQSGLSGIPLYFISPVADQSLAYSNILAEWLTLSKQSKVYLPEEPFPHAMMVRLGRLKHYPGIHVDAFSNDYRTPCVVFTGHPSLRFGDVVHFVELWGPSPNNLIVFTEPDFPYLEALAPFQPLALKVAYCPIDTSLSYNQGNKLIKDLSPKTLVTPYQYSVAPPLHRHRADLVLETEGNMFTYKKNETIKLPIKRKYERVEIESDLSLSLIPAEIRPGLSVATITGTLVAKDNKFQLQALTKGQIQELANASPGHSLPPVNYTWGSLDLHLFVQKLAKAGIFDASIEQTQSGCIVHLRSEEAFVTVDESSTHIVCDANSNLRIVLKELVTQCLRKF